MLSFDIILKHHLLLKNKLIRDYMVWKSIWKNYTVKKLSQCFVRQSLRTEELRTQRKVIMRKGRGSQGNEDANVVTVQDMHMRKLHMEPIILCI